MEWPFFLLNVVKYICMAALIIYYPICHLVAGPLLLKSRRGRKIYENYLYFGNLLQMRHDIKELAKSGDDAAMKIRKTMKYSNITVFVCLPIFIGLMFLAIK